MESDEYISARLAGTLDGLFRERVQRTPDSPAYTVFARDSQQWQSLTWQQMADQVGRWQAAFRKAKLENGDRVAILLRNGPDWVAVDQAALGQGLVVVPLYTEDRPDNIAYVIQDAGAKLLVVQSAHHWQNLLSSGPSALAGVRHVILLEGDADLRDTPEETQLWTLRAWLPREPQALRERGGDPRALATIVYTSGTTGKPKGVMLSHQNILSVAEGAGTAMHVQSRQRLLSFLPLSHTFERSCGYYTPMMWGMEIAYARSVQTLAEDLLSIRPQVLVAVPRIFERIYEKIQAKLSKATPLQRRLFALAVETGWRHFQAQQGRARHGLNHLLWPLLKRRIADPVLATLGGNLELAISGGAALSTPVAKVFMGLGLNLIQGYGMTESAPVVTANRPERNDPTSVGLPLDGFEVRIGENDELQVNSPGVMLGYWNNHKATRESMTRDGWLRTGDKARIDNGFVYITGRLKDILVMSNGEKIPPVDMEDAIKLDPIFDNAVIVGEGKPYLAALVVLNPEFWFKLAQDHGLDPFAHTALQDPALHKTLLTRIAAALHDFPGYAKIRRIAPLLEPWTLENGLLTPTLKTKRQLVMQQFAEQIDRLYAN
jgi:long-chain acyl-CoA synthetase